MRHRTTVRLVWSAVIVLALIGFAAADGAAGSGLAE